MLNESLSLRPFPTTEELAANPVLEKEYVAELWARVDEEIAFRVHFSKGSHVEVKYVGKTFSSIANCT